MSIILTSAKTYETQETEAMTQPDFRNEFDENRVCMDFMTLLRVMFKEGVSKFYINGTDSTHNLLIASKINKTCNSSKIGDFSISTATYSAFKNDKECFKAINDSALKIGSMSNDELNTKGGSEFKRARIVCERYFKAKNRLPLF